MPSEPQQPSAALHAHGLGRPWGRLPSRDAREQLKEVGILLSLILVRMQMLNYLEALDSSEAEKMHAFKAIMKEAGIHFKSIYLYTATAVVAGLILCVILRRRIPRRLFDFVIGPLIVFNLIFHFLKINLLLLTPPADPGMLLGQIFTYLIFFVVAWGWIFWRFDWVGKDMPGTVIDISDKGDYLSTFDYFHASFMALVRRGRPEVSGLTRTGKILVAIHTFMLLDLIAVALGRFYHLIVGMI